MCGSDQAQARKYVEYKMMSIIYSSYHLISACVYLHTSQLPYEIHLHLLNFVNTDSENHEKSWSPFVIWFYLATMILMIYKR